MVVGAKNSAAIAALELWWTGARVTLVHRGAGIHNNVKYWIKPNIENRIKNGEIRAYFHSQVIEIRPGFIAVRHAGKGYRSEERFRVRNDRLSSRPRFSGRAWASRCEPETQRPLTDPETLKANGRGSIWPE